ncbi:MAG: HEAT repeat domain-containing protein [Verrucomicrobiota bacterium]
MNKRLRFAFAILLLVVLAGAGWRLCHAREPEYQGRNLTAWLRRLEAAPEMTSPAWRESVAAIRAIGTNGLPTLLTMLGGDDSRWRVQVVTLIQDTANVDLSELLAEAVHRRARIGFQVLGRSARPAIPRLAAFAATSDPALAERAFLAMLDIGGPETIPPLLKVLTNSTPARQILAANYLGQLRSQARDAVPKLVQALSGSDVELRATAARALGNIGWDAPLAVPALTSTLADADSRVRAAAAMALGAFGTQAESALPVLREMPDDLDQFGRRVIPRTIIRVQCELQDGGIIRGPIEAKHIALVFTGHEFAEGGETILSELVQRQGRASFFLTGTFLQNPQFKSLVRQIVAGGHYLGPHSDKHLLYCAWDESRRTLVSEEEFTRDLLANAARLPERGSGERRFSRYFLPPFEHYNREIVDWTRQQRWTLINFTPGTRSNADYTGEADPNFVSSAAIFDSILQRELADPHGLSGYILLLHLGSGPGRADKFHVRFGELLDKLGGQGYQFVRVDELLGPRREANAPNQILRR